MESVGRSYLPKTRHAMLRLQQRGISEEQLNLVESFGVERRRSGGAIEFFLSERAVKRAAQNNGTKSSSLERAKRISVIICSIDGCLLTAYRSSRRWRRP